jgi:hypothetical protein
MVERTYAAICWQEFGVVMKNPAKAISVFEQRFAAHARTRAALIKFMKFNNRKLAERGNPADRPRSGRKRKLPLSVALQAATTLMNGYVDKDGRRLWWNSARAGMQSNASLAAVAQDYNVTVEQLKRYMKKAQPKLCRRTMYIKKPLNSKRKDARPQRLRDAIALLAMPEEDFQRVFWLDAAGVDVCPKATEKVWASRDEENMVVLDPHMALSGKSKMVLKYYALVNYFSGACGVVFVTGTTGLAKEYRVRPMPEALTCMQLG